jgi:hypothetical protein
MMISRERKSSGYRKKEINFLFKNINLSNNFDYIMVGYVLKAILIGNIYEIKRGSLA